MNEDFNKWWEKFGELLLQDFSPQLSAAQIEQFKTALDAAYGSGDANGSMRTFKAWGDSLPPVPVIKPQQNQSWWKW